MCAAQFSSVAAIDAYHVHSDFADFGGAMLLAEGLDAFLLLRDLLGEDGPQVGAVGRVSSENRGHRVELLEESKINMKIV